jgi:tetratricopeptide (TPR) repeat protein
LKSQEEELKAAALDIDKLLQYFHVSNLRGELAAAGIKQPHELQSISSEVIDYVTSNPTERQRIRLAQYWMDTSSHVYLTWQFDIDALSKKNPDAMRVLEYASLLSSKNIPGRLLQAMAFPENGGRAPCLFSRSILDLSAHALISAVESNDVYSCDVHALVQSTVFHRLIIRQTDDLDAKLSGLCHYLLQNIPVGLVDIERNLKGSEFQQLIPHVYCVAAKVLMIGCQKTVYKDFVRNACWMALTAEHFDSAAQLCQKQLEIMELSVSKSRDLDDVNRHVTALIQCGRYYSSLQGQPSVAQDYYARALQRIQEVEIDGNEPLRQHYNTVLIGLALCYQNQHQYSEAERLYVNHLSLLNNCEHSDQRSVLPVMANLAALYNTTGHSDRAIDLYQQAISIAMSMPGTEILTSSIMNNLGQCLIDVGNFSGAADILEQSLTIMREWRPDDHRDVAAILRLLSSCCVSLGDLSRAKRMAEEALSIMKSILDPHHPLLAVYMSQLADCYHSAGDWDRDITVEEQVVEILRQSPDSRNDLCAALNNLSMSYANNGMIQKALSTLEECITIQKSFLPRLHPAVAKS